MNDIERNCIYQGDCLEIMEQFSSNCVDLVFTDPPYNLQKNYGSYSDDLASKEYIEWCNKWLYQLFRILKPSGSLFLLNLPKWSIYHAIFLDKYMYRQNWIVWDALSVPRGKIMPAHYSILYYTGSRENYTFNEIATKARESFCQRESCIKKRERDPTVSKEPLSDLWFDLHRIRHRKDRDPHPCQLPLALVERIILLASNRGDLVFDPFMGVGTTAIVAKLLGRDYAGIEIDTEYVAISEQKIASQESYRDQLRIANKNQQLKKLTSYFG
ncbi:MAG: DNA-methyltransferase [Candidatus Odinarchaeota archaeon]